MVDVFKKRSTESRLFTVAKEFCLDSSRFADETSDTLRGHIPMKELFLTYVDLFTNGFLFYHGPNVTPETVRFYDRYPLKVLPEDYMARAVYSRPPGNTVIDREAIDHDSEIDFQVERRALTETHNKSMALTILSAPCDFLSNVKHGNRFLQYGVIAITVYGDLYDDFYTDREKKLMEKYFRYLRMGVLDTLNSPPKGINRSCP